MRITPTSHRLGGGLANILHAILNNNAVVVRRHKRDILVVTRGIGFTAKKGHQLTLQDSILIYVPTHHAKLKIAMATIASLPDTYLTIAARIIQTATVQLHTKFNSYLLIELADTITFADTRYTTQLIHTNKLLWEIQIA